MMMMIQMGTLLWGNGRGQSYVARTQAKDRGARAWARVRGKENGQGQCARSEGTGDGTSHGQEEMP